jgi:hypothetical protein
LLALSNKISRSVSSTMLGDGKGLAPPIMLHVCISLVRSLERRQTLLPEDSQTIKYIYKSIVLCISFTHTRRTKSVPTALFNPALHGGECRASRSDCSVP